MAEAVVRDYPRDEIIQHHAELQRLLADMAARSAGRKSASGRYKKYDTARLKYINTVALPSLRLGKRIDAEDWRLLFLPITCPEDRGSTSDKAKLDRWCKMHKQDPRSKSSVSYGLDKSRQLTLLEWVGNNTEGYVPPPPAPVGKPPEYRLEERVSKDYAGCTLSGLQQLLARLRVTDGGTAPRRLLPLATAPSTDLGVRGPLPLLNGATGATRQMEIRHDLGTASTLAQASTDASANSSALGSAKASAPVLKSAAASAKVRSAAYLERLANSAREKYAASKGCAYKSNGGTYKARENGPTSKERRAQQQREKYAAVRGDAYKPRASARGPRESSQARPSKRQRTQPDGEVVGSET